MPYFKWSENFVINVIKKRIVLEIMTTFLQTDEFYQVPRVKKFLSYLWSKANEQMTLGSSMCLQSSLLNY
jgi:hypothetical protein